MKKFLALACLTFCMSSFSQKEKESVKVIEIDSTESKYMIKGVLKRSKKMKVLIISTKYKMDSCLKLKIGKTYKLELLDYFDRKNVTPIGAHGDFRIEEEGYVIWDSNSDAMPFKSPDIVSNCILEEHN